MSISAESWKCGAVAFDSAIRRATVCWSFVRSWWVTAPLAVSGRSRAPGWARRGRPAAPPARPEPPPARGPAAIARSTSALTIRPPGPEPESAARSSPFSLAIRRARGEALTLPSPLGRAGAGASAAAPARGPAAVAPPRRPRLAPPPQRASRLALRRGAVAGRLLPCLAHPRDHLADRQRVPLLRRGSRPGSRRRAPRRPCWPCRSRSRPAPRRARPRRRATSASAGSCPPPSSPRAAA